MSIYQFAVLCAVLGVAAVEAKGCCTPDQWEGSQYSVTGYVKGFLHRKPGVERGAVSVAYDYTNQRTAAFANFTGNAGKRSYRIVRRYDNGQGRLYIVDLQNDKCYQKNLTKPFRAACVPDEAKELGEYTFGAGNASLQAKGYAMGIDTDKYKLELSITVTADNCVPIGENIVGLAREVPLMENVGFVDINPGIADPSVFDVPSQCEETVSGYFMSELVEEYKILAIV